MAKTFFPMDKLIKLPKFDIVDKNIIKINENNIFNDLKKEIVDIVYKNRLFGKYRSLKSLEEFYCNPYKQNGHLKLFNNDLIPNQDITGDIKVSGIWISNKSFGAYCILTNTVNLKNEYLFMEQDSDSDSDIDSDINYLLLC